MRKLVLCSFVLAAILPLASFAEEGKSCTAAAADKKLSGAAKTSFLKKCERDASASCDTAAAEKKIYGAAKNSFTKKCLKDAVGAAG
jgi:hypothetical protein